MIEPLPLAYTTFASFSSWLRNLRNVSPFLIREPLAATAYGSDALTEGALSDTYGGNATTRDTIYNANKNVLSPLYGPYDSGTRFGFDDYGTDVYCFGSVDAVADSRGGVGTEDNIGSCSVDNTGGALCYDY